MLPGWAPGSAPCKSPGGGKGGCGRAGLGMCWSVRPEAAVRRVLGVQAACEPLTSAGDTPATASPRSWSSTRQPGPARLQC